MSTSRIVEAATWVSNLSVSGLAIFDLDEIKELMLPHDLPCLMPHPKNFITQFSAPLFSMSRKRDRSYTLNYRLYFKPVTGTLKFFGPYSDLVKMAVKILDGIIDATPPDGMNIMPAIKEIGGVEDSAGNMYHGCDFEFTVTELIIQ
jgi:hypothetical protein